MLSNSDTAYRPHDHGHCLDTALGQAARLCARRAARLTPLREAVLRLIWQSHQPVSAYDLIDRLARQSGRRVMPPTVYRALDFLRAMGLVHRLASLNAFVGCPFPDRVHSDLFLVCRRCGSVAECSAEGVDAALRATALSSGFAVESQTLELLGLCGPCQDDGR